MPIKKHSPFKIVKMFEEELASYTGSKYAVTVDSCTNALFLASTYLKVKKVTIPSQTYLSVPMSIIHAGGDVVFDKSFKANAWQGIYQLKPYPIYDAAKRFTKDMYVKNSFMCLSFHIKKLLNIGKGGAILTDSEEAYEWFKKARYEGRGEVFYKQDNIETLGWNMYMTPQDAAQGLCLMQILPEVNADQIEHNGYRDLTEFPVFNKCKIIK